MRRLPASLELVRPANLCTAAADVTAGFFYMGGRWQDADVFAPLIVASICLYAGGVALNDVCDAPRDAVERPGRPISSGRVTRRGAALLAGLLLAVGVAASTLASRRALIVSSILVGVIVLYDTALKPTVFGPWAIGVCRALNLSLGFSVHPTFRTLGGTAPILFLMMTYTASVGVFARDEAGVSSRFRLILGTSGVGLSALGLVVVPFIVPDGHFGMIVFAALMTAVLVSVGVRAARRRQPEDVQRAVGSLLTGLVGFDAAIAWASRGIGAGCITAMWLLPAIYLRRRFPMS